MAISYVTQAQAGTSTITLPTGIQADDLIIAYGYRNTTTAPTLPTGYTNIFNQSGNTNAQRLCYLFAAGTESGTTLTFTNANVIQVAIYRGVAAVGGASSTTAATGTSQTVTGIGTMQTTDGTSWAVSVFGSKQITSTTTPAGTTLRGTVQTETTSSAMLVDSNGGVSSWAAHSTTLGTTATAASGSVELKAIKSFSTFSDAFNGGSLNSTLWTPTTGGSGTLAYSGAGAAIGMPNPTTGADQAIIQSNLYYDLTSSSASLHVASTYDPTTHGEFFFAVIASSNLSNDYIEFVIYQNTLYFQYLSGGSTFGNNIPYSPISHAWLRIRESGGTVYWDASADGYLWYNISNVAHPFAVTKLLVSIQGVDQTTSENPGTAIVNNFNILPSGPASHNIGLLGVGS